MHYNIDYRARFTHDYKTDVDNIIVYIRLCHLLAIAAASNRAGPAHRVVLLPYYSMGPTA